MDERMRRGDFMDLLLTPCARGAGAGMMKVDDGPFPPRTSLTARRSTERRHEADVKAIRLITGQSPMARSPRNSHARWRGRAAETRKSLKARSARRILWS